IARFARRFFVTRQRPSASRTTRRSLFIWSAVSPRYSASTVTDAFAKSSVSSATFATFSARFMMSSLSVPSGRRRARRVGIDPHRRPHGGGDRDADQIIALGRGRLRAQQAREDRVRVLTQLVGAEAPLADRDLYDAGLLDAELDLTGL